MGNADDSVTLNAIKILDDECDDSSAINYWLGPLNNNPTGFLKLDIGGKITILKIFVKNSHNGIHQNR